ncbi:MAG: hypothetical protein J7K85_06815, partial [Anaerolineaceae bacterium]|nr:hypothetical protein [Anaerolineaceae bacterium]
SEEEAVPETTETAAFEGTAPLPGWLSDEVQEEVPSEEEAVLEQTEPAAIEGTAQLPDWMAGIDAKEAPSEEEAVPETTEPAAIEGTAQLPDWMAGIDAEEAPSEEEAVPETTEPAAFEGTAPLPGWLSDEVQEEVPSEEEAVPETTETAAFEGTAPLPGWLSDEVQEEVPSEEEATLDITETVPFKGTAPLPGWLSDETEKETAVLPEEEEAILETTETAAFEGTAQLPDWMAGIDAEEAQPQEEAATETTETVPFKGTAPLPGWLSDEEQESVLETAETAAFEGTAPLPGWLSDEDQEEVSPEETEASFEQTEPVVIKGTAPLPGWIADEIEEEGQREQPDEEISLDSFDGIRTEGKEETDLLSWLSEEDIPLEEEFPVEDEISMGGDSFLLEDTIELPESFTFEDLPVVEELLQDSTPEDNVELPEWLEKEVVEYQESVIPEETLNIDLELPLERQDEEAREQGSEFLADIEEGLPQWITERNETSSFEGNLEQTGPLKGLRGLLPSETIFLSHQRPPIYTNEIKFTDEDSRRVAMMENILTSENNKRPKLKSYQRDYNTNLRLILTAILGLTILLGLFVPKKLSTNAISNPPTPVVQFYQLLQNNIHHSSQRPVLLIVDTQPAHFSELRAYVELPMKSLMESNTRILTFSSKPEGTFLSRAMLKEIMVDYRLNYDLDNNVFNIGFLSGGSTALRSFALNMRTSTYGLDVGTSGEYVWDQPEIADIDSIDDFSMIIVMADTVEKAQRWIEQVGTLLPESTQLLFITSAQATPILKAYLNTGQIDGLIGSPLDAAAYATLDNQINDAILYWNAYRLAIIIMIVVIVSGVLYHNLDSFKNIQLNKPNKKRKAGKK